MTFYNQNIVSYYNDHDIKNFTSNEKILQLGISRACGYHAVFYLAQLCRDIALARIVELFHDSDFEINDAYIHEYIINTYSTCFFFPLLL